MHENTLISLRGIRVDYDDEPVLKGIDLDIMDKEFITFLGPSGCGKTTTLRIIGGFIQPKEGDVFFGGVRINDLPPYKREVNTVFQRYALFPHLNVYENVEFGLKIAKVPEKERRQSVKEMLKLVGLSGYDRRHINQLSGGQQQRVAIARALVNRPKVLLLQIGTPQDIYNEPCNAFVADFIGESNIIDGIMHKDYLVEFANDYFDCVDKGFSLKERVQVVVRPEDFKIVPADKGKISGIVESIIFKGVHYEIMVDAMGYKWKIHTTQYVEPGTLIGMDVAPMDIHIMKRTED